MSFIKNLFSTKTKTDDVVPQIVEPNTTEEYNEPRTSPEAPLAYHNRSLFVEDDVAELGDLLKTSEVQLMPNINKLLSVYQSKIKRVIEEQNTTGYRELRGKIFTIHEKLPDISLNRIALALNAVNGDVDRAIENLKNGLIGDEDVEEKNRERRVRYYDAIIDLDTVKQNDKIKSSKVVKKSFFSFGGVPVEELEQQYLKQVSFMNMLIEEKKLLKGDTTELSTPETPDTNNKILFEKRLIEKRLREEKLARNTKFYCDGEVEALQNQKFKRYKLLPSSVFDCDAEQIHYRFVESTFHRLMMNGGGGQYHYKVSEVDYIVNPELMKKFNQRKIDLANQHGFLIESMKPLLLFHGTSEENMEKIVQTGFLLEKIGSATDMGW